VPIDTVLIKVASRCNINCTYCYVYNMGDGGWSRAPHQITPETVRAAANSLGRLATQQETRFDVVLHGGEPLAIGARKLDFVLGTLREQLSPEYGISIQTNGILITSEILDVCSARRATISISIDGPRNVHDRNRIDFSGNGTFDKVLDGIAQLQTHPDHDFLFTGVLAVIDPASRPEEVYSFFKTLAPPTVDFIYRDGNHSRLPGGKAEVATTEYGEWLAAFFDIYSADPHSIPVRVLDDLIKLVLGGAGSKEGVGVTDYGILVVDTDGTITKNDTLKSSFDGADRFASAWSIASNDLTDLVRSEEFAAYHAMQRPTSPICLACPELHVCGGGMTLQRWHDDNGYDNPSVYCADQKLLIAHIREAVAPYATAPA
jgi:uncharacterized protein